ncbi:MAG: carbon storage regulator [Planctomycetaceae bacterium]|nr:carbon storage regulator [Planctomycetaceae bacterium]
MLVLSRKCGEEIVIGDNIRVQVIQSSGGRVRLGISAPDEVSIKRSEIIDKQIRQESLMEIPDHFLEHVSL